MKTPTTAEYKKMLKDHKAEPNGNVGAYHLGCSTCAMLETVIMNRTMRGAA